jgi:hypothetical protein
VLSGIEAVGVQDPAVQMCGTLALDWKGSTAGISRASAGGC